MALNLVALVEFLVGFNLRFTRLKGMSPIFGAGYDISISKNSIVQVRPSMWEHKCYSFWYITHVQLVLKKETFTCLLHHHITLVVSYEISSASNTLFLYGMILQFLNYVRICFYIFLNDLLYFISTYQHCF